MKLGKSIGPGDDVKKRKKAYVLAESPIKDGKRDDAFIIEGNNVKSFYQKNHPDTDVEVIPFYGQDEFNQIKEKLKGSTDEDRVFLFGHSGDTLGGVKHEEIAKTLKDSGVKNCDIGSCNFESKVNPYKDLQNVTYRGKDQWLGFNPKSSSIIEGMYSRANDYDKGVVGIVKPEEGVQYNRIFNRPVAEIINPPARPMPQGLMRVGIKP